MIFCDIGVQVYRTLTHFYKGTRIALMEKIRCTVPRTPVVCWLIFPRYFGVLVFFSLESPTICLKFKLSQEEVPGGLNVLLSPLT